VRLPFSKKKSCSNSVLGNPVPIILLFSHTVSPFPRRLFGLSHYSVDFRNNILKLKSLAPDIFGSWHWSILNSWYCWNSILNSWFSKQHTEAYCFHVLIGKIEFLSSKYFEIAMLWLISKMTCGLALCNCKRSFPLSFIYQINFSGTPEFNQL